MYILSYNKGPEWPLKCCYRKQFKD